MHLHSNLRWFVPRTRFNQVSGVIFALAVGLTASAFAHSPFDNFKNYGLVGVGRIPSDTFDRFGNGHQDTLGGLFSSMDTISGFSLFDGKFCSANFWPSRIADSEMESSITIHEPNRFSMS